MSALSKWSAAFENLDVPKSSLTEPQGMRWTLTESDQGVSAKRNQQSKHLQIMEKRAWEAAIAPGKSIFMNLIMIWLSGTSTGIF